MVFALGFLVLGAMWALNPANWAWISAVPSPPAARDAAKPVAASTPANMESRQRVVPIPPLPPDTVRIVNSPGAEGNQEHDYYPGVVPGHLREVRDNRPFRPQEAAAWFNLLAILKTSEANSLIQAAEGNVSYVQLDQQPGAYRGRLVGFKGRIHRIRQVEVGQNSEGISHCYELILKPQDGPPRPVVAYVLQLPTGLQPDEKLDEQVQLTGFFFKNWLYAGQHSTYVAPVLLARSVNWTRSVPEPVYAPSFWAIAGIMAGSAAVATILALWAYYASQRITNAPAPVSPVDMQAALAVMAKYDAPADLGTRDKWK